MALHWYWNEINWLFSVGHVICLYGLDDGCFIVISIWWARRRSSKPGFGIGFMTFCGRFHIISADFAPVLFPLICVSPMHTYSVSFTLKIDEQKKYSRFHWLNFAPIEKRFSSFKTDKIEMSKVNLGFPILTTDKKRSDWHEAEEERRKEIWIASAWIINKAFLYFRNSMLKMCLFFGRELASIEGIVWLVCHFGVLYSSPNKWPLWKFLRKNAKQTQ